MTINVAWSEVLGPWHDDEDAEPRERIRAIYRECANPECRFVFQVPQKRPHLIYCDAVCARRVVLLNAQSRERERKAPLLREQREKRDAEICRRVADGQSRRQIAAELHVSPTTIAEVMRAHGLKSRDEKTTAANAAARAAADDIRAAYDGGEKQEDIAARYGVGVWIVRDLCARRNKRGART